MMKLLHTSDWHLGRSLYGRTRYDEHSSFLDWLVDVIEKNYIDVLLVAGDIFDTSTPSNKAQELYYRFLCKLAAGGCRHVVIVAGNHDSPSFLSAPKELLLALNIHVVAAVTDAVSDEIIVLDDNQGNPQAIVCAVPYLRDRDIRIVIAGESVDDKRAKLVSGIRDHYAAVCNIAEQKQQELGGVPIIATGHLFTNGGQTIDGDGVRELYIGSLAHIGKETFPSCIDYLGLGHLHVPQTVGGATHFRYSGSPIPCGFGEANQEKQVVLVEFVNSEINIEELVVPCFQPLVRITGSIEDIQNKIVELKGENSTAWLEVEYTDSEILGGNLRGMVDDAVVGSLMEVRRVRNRQIVDQVMRKTSVEETLDDLNVHDVFQRCLESFNVLDAEQVEMVQVYQEIVNDFLEEDKNAE